MLAYCRNCTTAYAVDLSSCPNCGSPDRSPTPVERQPEPIQAEDIPAGAIALAPDTDESDADA